jgi:hypothetical protein
VVSLPEAVYILSDKMANGTRRLNMKPSEVDTSKSGKDIVVFSIVRDSKCSECGVELSKGSFLKMEKDRPLCLECADLDHLVFLPTGDTALTRRSRKYSRLSAVVVRFSRSRDDTSVKASCSNPRL